MRCRPAYFFLVFQYYLSFSEDYIDHVNRVFDKDTFDGSLIILFVVTVCVINTRAVCNHLEDFIFRDMHLCYLKCIPDQYFGYLFSVPLILILKGRADNESLLKLPIISNNEECQQIVNRILMIQCHPKLPSFGQMVSFKNS